MKLKVAAVGRLSPGPEKTLIDTYVSRADAAGRPLALGPLSFAEIDERKARSQSEQGERLLAAAPAGAHVIALDERGKQMSSPDFAALLAKLRDQGVGETAFLIGGADGHQKALRERADRLISLGPMVWPHMLVRVMLTEQIYRAISILGGGPYHRA
ncbi:23S rRNA (pseudouridine(1915)-N(3))-methyltransferase RlmH [Rhodobacteraceae bacterium NNCM2]|nr:23S rRNA (pseudouridine(1915)-N(3))-methyltransferase RlmH [Coraliihabitans acroporae]